MNLAKTIEGLPDDRLCRDCADEDGYCPNRSLPCEISYSDLKRLVKLLRKCETALNSLPSDALGTGGKPDSTRWYLRGELLSEIREVLG